MGNAALAATFGSFKYRPLPSQDRFHGDIRTKYRGFSGPVGSGKSNALAYEAIICAALNPGRTGLIGAPTYPMLADATMRSILDALESEGIEYTYNRSRHVLQFPNDGVFRGATVLCRTMDQPERLRGTNVAWFGVDELTYCKEE